MLLITFELLFQLKKYQDEGRILVDFEEGQIDFDPTYKYDIGTHRFDSR